MKTIVLGTGLVGGAIVSESVLRKSSIRIINATDW